MNVNLYCPQGSDNVISFSLLGSVNSISIYLFDIGAPINSGHGGAVATRLVSGYERGLRNICMNLECVTSYDKNAYLVSCVRTPYVLRKLMVNKNFARTVSPMVVQARGEVQVWHVLGVCKGKEIASIARVRGVSVCENGVESYVAKEIIALRGNIPAAFVAALSRNSPHVRDVEAAQCVYPWLRINDEDVTVHTK
ncbi:ac146-like protein [Peridroma alphabaculovirus]|uniref:Ac146-like protein n=1 Tax=Peridroma alphabaculovirus TaxID=1346829 RepID=A0A068LKN5_9ABAC|nr:ac146-like protein [Peridroma alphabaculovirus]AIE47857.1 ac146-like protein [Peridroma alphabaculovirus]